MSISRKLPNDKGMHHKPILPKDDAASTWKSPNKLPSDNQPMPDHSKQIPHPGSKAPWKHNPGGMGY